jgi:hypothetical protein
MSVESMFREKLSFVGRFATTDLERVAALATLAGLKIPGLDFLRVVNTAKPFTVDVKIVDENTVEFRVEKLQNVEGWVNKHRLIAVRLSQAVAVPA